jgi:hypothetical protein
MSSNLAAMSVAGISMDQIRRRISRRLGSAKALKGASTDPSILVQVFDEERTLTGLYQTGSDSGSPNHGNTPLSKNVISRM